jgi:hypothetical protein
MDYKFSNLLGAPYRGGDLLLHGNTLLSPTGNRVSQVRTLPRNDVDVYATPWSLPQRAPGHTQRACQTLIERRHGAWMWVRRWAPCVVQYNETLEPTPQSPLSATPPPHTDHSPPPPERACWPAVITTARRRCRLLEADGRLPCVVRAGGVC